MTNKEAGKGSATVIVDKDFYIKKSSIYQLGINGWKQISLTVMPGVDIGPKPSQSNSDICLKKEKCSSIGPLKTDSNFTDDIIMKL